jgi:hypothetical protein
MRRIISLLILCLLVGCAAPSGQPAEQPPAQNLPVQNLPPPPSAADLRRVSEEIGTWVQITTPDGSSVPAPRDEQTMASYTLGRPTRIALLDRDTIFQFAPGQSMQAQLRPTGEWFIPVYQDQLLVAMAELDVAYTIVGVGSLTDRQPPASIFAGYDDPEAEVWYVKFTKYPPMLLLNRPSGETMAPFHTSPNSLYPPIAALGGQEVAPDVMMRTLADVITENCRILWLFWQC